MCWGRTGCFSMFSLVLPTLRMDDACLRPHMVNKKNKPCLYEKHFLTKYKSHSRSGKRTLRKITHYHLFFEKRFEGITRRHPCFVWACIYHHAAGLDEFFAHTTTHKCVPRLWAGHNHAGLQTMRMISACHDPVLNRGAHCTCIK